MKPMLLVTVLPRYWRRNLPRRSPRSISSSKIRVTPIALPRKTAARDQRQQPAPSNPILDRYDRRMREFKTAHLAERCRSPHGDRPSSMGSVYANRVRTPASCSRAAARRTRRHRQAIFARNARRLFAIRAAIAISAGVWAGCCRASSSPPPIILMAMRRLASAHRRVAIAGFDMDRTCCSSTDGRAALQESSTAPSIDRSWRAPDDRSLI